jgi:hypothetical protein
VFLQDLDRILEDGDDPWLKAQGTFQEAIVDKVLGSIRGTVEGSVIAVDSAGSAHQSRTPSRRASL